MPDTTSPPTRPIATQAKSRSIGEEWRRFGTFLRSPVLPERATGFGTRPLLNVLRLYLLDIVLMSVLAVIAVAVMATGIEFPENKVSTLEMTPWLIAMIVIGAPVSEEVAFRSWLSGKARHFYAALLLGIGVVAVPTAYEAVNPATAAVIAAIVILMVGAILRRQRDDHPASWFARAFSAIFWLVALAFALVHLFNFENANPLFALPLVIPQFVAGLAFGYARVQYGLWASILLHALHNGTAIAVVLLGQVLATAA